MMVNFPPNKAWFPGWHCMKYGGKKNAPPNVFGKWHSWNPRPYPWSLQSRLANLKSSKISVNFMSHQPKMSMKRSCLPDPWTTGVTSRFPNPWGNTNFQHQAAVQSFDLCLHLTIFLRSGEHTSKIPCHFRKISKHLKKSVNKIHETVMIVHHH